MANEAILITETGPPVFFTVADGAGIEKGSVCAMADLMVASAATSTGQMVAGIAASEKIANDGNTTLGMYRQGIFKVYLSGACSVGHALAINSILGYRNYVERAGVALSGGATIGIALEAGTDKEQIKMELRPGVGSAIS